jgi:hypothetical protein
MKTFAFHISHPLAVRLFEIPGLMPELRFDFVLEINHHPFNTVHIRAIHFTPPEHGDHRRLPRGVASLILPNGFDIWVVSDFFVFRNQDRSQGDSGSNDDSIHRIIM